jgi:quercetin dioxygenase-like cupin family protein
MKKPSYHPKGWGYELWIHNDEKYCGKLLFFKEGKRCSLHYHKKKHETFYLQSGKMLLRYSPEKEGMIKKTILTPGDVFEIPPRLAHQMIALEDSELFEFSTQHFESDSYRIEKGD